MHYEATKKFKSSRWHQSSDYTRSYPYVAPTTPAYDPYATTPAYNPYAAPATTPATYPYAAPVSTYVDPASTYVAPVTQYDASGYPITATVSYYQQLAKVTPESTPEVTPEATLEAPLTIPTNTVSTPEGAPLTIPTNNVPTVSNGYYGWPWATMKMFQHTDHEWSHIIKLMFYLENNYC